MSVRALKPEEYFIEEEPYYEPVGDELAVFEVAYKNQLPVLLKGPTGCGKTRFMEHMAWRLKLPLITVSCHEDLTAADGKRRGVASNHESIESLHSGLLFQPELHQTRFSGADGGGIE